MIIKKSRNGQKTITTADKFEESKVKPTTQPPPKKEFKPLPPKKPKQFKIITPNKPKKGCGCGK